MTALIHWLVDTTLSLTALLVLLLVVRHHVARHLGAATAYRLWLLVPVYLSATLLVPAGMAAYHVELTPLTVQIGYSGSSGGWSQAGSWWGVGLVWALGAGYVLVRLLQAVAGGFRLVRESFPAEMRDKDLLVDAGPTNFEIRESSAIRSPTVAGLFQPALLLPGDFFTSYSTAEQQLILIHEICHMRRRDNLATVAAWAFTAVFWFNPLVHMVYRTFRVDQELSCDARVLAKANDSERKAYGRALLKSAATMEAVAVTSSWQNVNDLKERIMMLKNHRHSCRSSLASLTLVTTLSLAAMSLSVNSFATDQASKQVGMPDEDPVLVKRTPPRYPLKAAQKKIEGSVVMQFTVDTGGRVKNAKIVESEPAETFDEVALDAIRQWRFEPAMKAGEPVAVETEQAIRFELD